MTQFNRKNYMDGLCSHDQYYAQFVDQWVVNLVVNSIGKDRILASTKDAFNDIPLHLWDRLSERLCESVQGDALGISEGSTYAPRSDGKPQKVWSLCTGVCLAKAAARIYKESQKMITWTKVNRDANGNSRHVCHFLALLTQAEKDKPNDIAGAKYAIALKRANKIGGKKFHNKQYGGGIVFQCYDPVTEIEPYIQQAIKDAQK